MTAVFFHGSRAVFDHPYDASGVHNELITTIEASRGVGRPCRCPAAPASPSFRPDADVGAGHGDSDQQSARRAHGCATPRTTARGRSVESAAWALVDQRADRRGGRARARRLLRGPRRPELETWCRSSRVRAPRRLPSTTCSRPVPLLKPHQSRKDSSPKGRTVFQMAAPMNGARYAISHGRHEEVNQSSHSSRGSLKRRV